MSRGGFERKNRGLDFPGMEGGDNVSERKIEARPAARKHAPRSIESRDDEICFEAIYRVYLSPLIRNVRACGLSAELDGNPLFFVSKGGDEEEKKKKERRSFFFLVSFSGRKFVDFETNLLKIFPKFSRTNVSLLSPFHFHLSPDLRVENLGEEGEEGS